MRFELEATIFRYKIVDPEPFNFHIAKQLLKKQDDSSKHTTLRRVFEDREGIHIEFYRNMTSPEVSAWHEAQKRLKAAFGS